MIECRHKERGTHHRPKTILLFATKWRKGRHIMKRLTKKNLIDSIKMMVKDAANESYNAETASNEQRRIFLEGYNTALHVVARSLYWAYISDDLYEYENVRAAIEEEFFKRIEKAEKTAPKEEPKTVKNAAPIRPMEKSEPAPKKAVKTAKKTETAPKKAVKTAKRAVKKAAEIVPVNAANGKPFTGRNKETALAYLKKINSTDGRFFTWNGKKDAGYRVKAGESGLKMAYFGTESRGTYPVWHISQLVKTVDASAAEEVKETIKREITLDDDGGNGKKKVFKVTIRK